VNFRNRSVRVVMSMVFSLMPSTFRLRIPPTAAVGAV
jgi:hypothetical protein